MSLAAWDKRIDWILKTVGLFAVIGFLVLRARYNYLGIPWDAALLFDLDRYLIELWHVALFLLREGVLILPLFGLLSYGLFKALAWLLYGPPCNRFCSERINANLAELRQRDLSDPLSVPVSLSAFAVIALLLLEFQAHQGVAIGNLGVDRVTGLSSWKVSIGLVVLAVVVAAILKLSPTSWWRRLLWSAAIGLSMLLLNAQGYSGDRAAFSCAILEVNGQPKRTALLLQERGDEYLFWRVDQYREAFVDIVNKSSVKSLQLGAPVDILYVARSCSHPPAGTKHNSTPYNPCKIMSSAPEQHVCSRLSSQR